MSLKNIEKLLNEIQKDQESLHKITSTIQDILIVNPVNVQTAAVILGYSKRYLENLTRERKIPSHKQHGRRIYYVSELLEWKKTNAL